MTENFTSLQSEKLNLLIAICAVLISAASFYATFIQADAAEKQVRAMTLPLLSFDHGNWVEEKNKPGIEFRLKNGGVGPAVLHNATFIYKDTEYADLNSWLQACCSEAWQKIQESEHSTAGSGTGVNLITSSLNNVVIHGQGSFEFLSLEHNHRSAPLYEALDAARRQTTVRTCYCSLLDECYSATGLTDATSVNACRH